MKNTLINTDIPEISRIVTAAVINQRFREALLTHPVEAIQVGYDDTSFRLSPAAVAIIIDASTRASKSDDIPSDSLHVFAATLAERCSMSIA